MKTSSLFRRRAFTLIELLVVIAIIAILAAVSLTAFNGIKKRAQRSAAVGAMRTIGQTMEVYVGENYGFYPPGGDDSDNQIASMQTAALNNPSMLAYYIEDLIDTEATEEEKKNRKILREIVPRSVLPFLEKGEGNEEREIYFLYHVDIDDTDPKPGSGSINPRNSAWGNKSAAIGFQRGQVPMISDIYLGEAWSDFKTEDMQTFWGHTFNVQYFDGSIQTLREDKFEWKEAIQTGG